MSSETKAKRGASASFKNPSESDHRKRPRNRTTQSCLNCHNSKRMCDRKRPACARCTQLGLTGLCVYEVDDPSQRSDDSQDEITHLLKRVAELEGVIRELKNKPHPRWSRSTNDQADSQHSRSHFDDDPESQNNMSPDASPFRTSSDCEESSLTERPSTRSSTDKSANVYPSILIPAAPDHQPSPLHSQYNASPPQSTPSPYLLTPTEEYIHPYVTIATQPDISLDPNSSLMFLAYPKLVNSDGCGVVNTSQADETFIKQHEGHCGCLYESTNYRAVLELSVRLRRAADMLAQSPSHRTGSTCLLNQRISGLDIFTTNTLSDMITSQENSLMNQEGSHLNTGILASNQIYGPSPCRPSSKAIVTSILPPWDIKSMDPGPRLPCDDSFMSWDPSRRHITFPVQ